MKEEPLMLSGQSSNTKNGFTILELVVVIVLTAMTTGLSVVGFGNLIASYNLTGATRELARQCQLARTKAIMEKNNFGIYLDFQRESYTLFRDNDQSRTYSTGDLVIMRKTFPASVDLYQGCISQCAGSGYSNKQLTLIFYPDGRCNGTDENVFIFISKKLRKTTYIYVNPQTGRVKISGV